MSYAYQTFTVFQVLTAAQVQSIMDSVRDHQHGTSSVSSTGQAFSSPAMTGTMTVAAATFSSTLTMSGTAANIALGSNYISKDGTDAGLVFDSSNNANFSAQVIGAGIRAFRTQGSGNQWQWGDDGAGGWQLNENGVVNPISVVPGGAITFSSTLTLNSAVVGGWTTPAFSAGDYTASGSMTWTVASGDVETFAYTIINKLMTVVFKINTTTVGGTPSTTLKITVPASKVATKTIYNTCYILDNGVRSIATCYAASGSVSINIERADVANWTASTDNTYVYGQITFEIN